MASQTEIANLALHHLGVQTIANISDSVPAAEACNDMWVPCRDDVLADYNWPFASVEEALATVVDTLLAWDYVYQYPSNAAAVWVVYNEDTVDKKFEQEFETKYIGSSNKRVIGSDLDEAYVEYTRKVADTTIWSPKFVMAFSFKLAAAVCVQLTGDEKKALNLLGLYNGIISEAKRIGSIEQIKKPSPTSKYKTARG